MVYDRSYSAATPYRLWYDAFTSCNDQTRDDKMRFLHCGGGDSRRRDCHSADALSASVLERLPKGEGGAAE